jgi:signal transduction histidine kinase
VFRFEHHERAKPTYRDSMLHEFISSNRGKIIDRCRSRVAARLGSVSPESEHEHGVPIFLDQVADALRHQERPTPQIGTSAALHGSDLLKRGFSVGQVVHDYGDICQSITEISVETNAPINADEFRTLSRCLGDAIAHAVTAYGSDSNKSARANGSARESERHGFFVHELRNLLQTTTFACDALLSGNVRLNGSTSNVLRRSLDGLHSLIGNSIAEVWQGSGTQHPEVFSVATFVKETAAASRLEAARHDVKLSVVSADGDEKISGDKRNLAAAMNNLLQNAYKFTREGSTVTLRTTASVDRIRIEVEDQCGGLPAGTGAELFHPFEQRGSGRSSPGLGLAYSQWAVVANAGRLYVRNVPGSGCILIVDLPRHGAPSTARTKSSTASIQDDRWSER